MFVGEWEGPNLKLPVFKKKICSCLYNNFFIKVLGILFIRLNESKNSKTFLWWHQFIDPPYVFGTNHTFLSTPHFTQHFSLYAIIFSKLLINAECFTSGIGPDYLMNVLKVSIIAYLGILGFIFHLKQKQKFHL